MAATFTLQAILANEGLPQAFEPTAFEPTAFDTGAIQSDWITLTGDVVDTVMQIARGFQSNAPDDLVAAPSTFTFSLDNSATNSAKTLGYYSPDASTVRPGWQIGIPIRLQITANGNTRTVFYGWLESIAPLAGLYDAQTVDCTAAGWLNQATSTTIGSLTAQVAQRGDQLVATLTALVTNPPSATSFATGIDTLPYSCDDLSPTSTVVDGFDSVTKSTFDRLFEKADGTLRYESRQTRETYMPPVLTVTDAAPGGTPSLAVTTVPAQRHRNTQYNKFQVTVHPKRVDAVAVVLYAYQISGSSSSIGPGQTVTLQAPYVDPNQQAQQVGGFNMLISDGMGGSAIGTSGALPVGDYQFFSAANGGGTDVSASMTVNVVYGATGATLTIQNTGSVTAFYYKLQCRGQGIYDYQTAIGVAVVSSSQSAQGQTAYQIDCPYSADPYFAQSAATYIASLWSRNASQLDQGIQLIVYADDEVTMDTLLQREISDPIAVTETVTGLTSDAYWINGVQLAIDERCNITFTFQLAPNLAGVVWTLGVAGASELGQTTVLGF